MIKRVENVIDYCASIGGGMIYSLHNYTLYLDNYFQTKEMIYDGQNYYIIGTGGTRND